MTKKKRSEASKPETSATLESIASPAPGIGGIPGTEKSWNEPDAEPARLVDEDLNVVGGSGREISNINAGPAGTKTQKSVQSSFTARDPGLRQRHTMQ